MGITKFVTEDGLCFNIRLCMFFERRTNESLEGKLQCVVRDDLCYKDRESLYNFIYVKMARLLLSLSLYVAFVSKARR